jgi:hypothetical protein
MRSQGEDPPLNQGVNAVPDTDRDVDARTPQTTVSSETAGFNSPENFEYRKKAVSLRGV